MNTNIVISLDTRRAKADGTFPLVLRLGHNERTTTIPAGYSLLQKDWDEEKRLVKKSYKGAESVERLNNMLQKKRNTALDVAHKLDEAKQLAGMSIVELKERIVNKGESQSFFVFSNQLIEELIKANRLGTAKSYKSVASILKTFCNGKDLSFSQLNFEFLRKFETGHYSKGNEANSLAVYMRTIRAIYNKAIKSRLVEKDQYPFSGYKIKTAPTEKRALEWVLLKKIIEVAIEPKDQCFNARNYFVASYMMYGMNFMDMAFLRKSDIVEGRIRYRRKKTSKLYDIKVTSSLETILNHYIAQRPDSEYVFPIIKRDTAIGQDKDIQWARKGYNKKLKLLATLCGIKENLTSYVSRHSFATQAMLADIPLNAISTMLGHSSLKTTEIYLKSLPSNILDDYNAKLLEGR